MRGSMTDIEKTFAPNSRDIDFLTEKINGETAQYGEAHPFGFFIRDEKGLIVAGANGFVLYGSIYTDQLWVDPKSRRQGLAGQLMEQVHKLGISEGCTFSAVSTMSFQPALNFYKKLGYKVDFERSGYINDSSCFFLKKKLPT